MVDVLIINWNSGLLLKNCIDSILLSSNENFLHQLFVIDNNSIDNSIELLPKHEKLIVIQNKENLGFSKACNQGFMLCSMPYVLLLNPDTLLMENTLFDAIDFMNKRQDVDILGCQLLDIQNQVSISCARFPTATTILSNSMGLHRIFPRLFKPALLMSDWSHNESRFVDQVMGAFMFMRKQIFEKVGYFDERFFVYFEDLDFSYRLSLLNGKSYYNTNIKAIHIGGGTTNSVKSFRLFLSLKSRLAYAKKHFSFTGYLFVVFATFIPEFISRFFLLVFTGRFNEIFDLLKGYKLLLFIKKK